MARGIRMLLAAVVAFGLLASSASADSTITVVKQGFQKGTVTSSPAGIVCGSTCTNSFADPQVTLTTTLPTGFTISWQGMTCVGNGEDQSGTSCTVVPNNGTITARYIDSTAPTISLTNPSSNGPFAGNLKLAASAFDSQSDISRVDFTVGATVVGSDTTSPYEYTLDTTAIPDGQVSIGAVAYNGDGQAKTANPRSVQVDNTPPALTITSGPDGQTFGGGSTQTFNFTAADLNAVTTVCSMDSDQQFAQCTDSASYSDLGEGGHTFRVKAVDAAGNQTDATRSFTIDRTGPTTTITGGPDELSSGTIGSVLFTFAASEDGAAFSCRLYPASANPVPDFGPCSGPASHGASGLAPGDWKFEVSATDSFGNAGPAAVRRFTVVFGGSDSLEPVVSARFDVHKGLTTVRKLRVGRMLRGTHVTVTCHGRSCSFKSRSVAARGRSAVLERLFKNHRLRAGTVVELRITAAGLTGRVVRFKMRSTRQPQRTTLCLPSGASTPVACS